MGKREKDSKGEKLMENEKIFQWLIISAMLNSNGFLQALLNEISFLLKKISENKHAKPIISDS